MEWIALGVGLIGLLIGAVSIASICLVQKDLKNLKEQIDYINTHKTNKRVTAGSGKPALQALTLSINEMVDSKNMSEENSRRMARELKEAITNVSHDLRTPLTAILGYLQLLEKDQVKVAKLEEELMSKTLMQETSSKEIEELKRLAGKQENYLETAKGRAESLGKLLENFYELTRLSSEEYKLQFTKVTISRVICELVASFHEAFVDKKLDFNIKIEDNLPAVYADSCGVERVITNVLQNALKYSKSSIAIHGFTSQEEVIIEFTNKAEGLMAEDVPYLFDRFFRADRVRSGEGTGIGLAVVKKLMVDMGGDAQAALHGENLTISLHFKKCNS